MESLPRPPDPGGTPGTDSPAVSEKDPTTEAESITVAEPSRTEMSRWFIAAVLLAAVALLLSVLYLGTSLFRPPPRVIIANILVHDQRSCMNVVAGGDVVFSFDLVNSGGTGIVRVQLFRDGTLQLTRDYNVSASSTSSVSMTQTLIDCDPYHWNLRILKEWSR